MSQSPPTREQLVEQIEGLRQRVVELEAADAERMLAEAALEESQQKTRAILDHTSHFIGLLKPDGTMVDANKAALGFGAIEEGDVVGKLFWDCPWWAHSPEQQEKLRAGVRRAAAGEFIRFDANHPTPDGQVRTIDGSLNPVTDETGKVIFIIPEGRDITERKQAEEERRELETKVQQTQKLESLGILAGGIAHDFNNLLVGILGNGELALNSLPPTSPVCAHVAALVKAAHRATALTSQMLAYSGKGQFLLEDIDLRALVEDIEGLLQCTVAKNAILQLDLPKDLPAIRADAAQIRQIVMNLVINAADAIGEAQGSIRVTAHTTLCPRSCPCRARIAGASQWPEMPRVVLEVSDDGCGMDDPTMSRIFEPFFTTKFTGRGLGMAAVHGILRGHQAGIEIESEPTEGTTIRVHFPALDHPAIADQRDEQRDEQPEESWRGSGLVLLVDDEAMVRDVTSQMLELAGFSVIAAADGVRAIELFRQRRKDIVCVLLDLKMPHKDGVETFDELRAIDEDVPVILCSGYSEEESTKRFSTKGLAGFLQKPYEMARLTELLREALAGSGQ
jgi:two-component system cell cycle sensor histidine kinase/response regulator CckA